MTVVEEFVQNPDNMRLFQQERAIYEVTDLLESLMEEVGISRAELAKKLGKTPGWVTQLMDGERNKTIRTVADAFAVLGHEYHSTSRRIQIGGKSGSQTTSGEATTTRPVGASYARPFGPSNPQILRLARAETQELIAVAR